MIIKNANYSAEKDADLNIISAAINFTNIDERTGSQVYGRIAITNEQAKQLEAKEIMPADVIEPMLVEILGIGIDEDDVARFVAIENELKEKTAEIEGLNASIEEKAEHIMTTATMKAEEITKQAQVAIETQVQSIRKAVKSLVKIDELAPEDIADLVALYEPWEEGESLAVGDIRSYDGKLWEVIQAHTTQGDWTPPTVPALFKEVAPAQTEEGEEIVPEWKQPTGGHDAYNIGDKVLFEGKVYESVIDANTWSPTDYPQGWKVIE